MLPVALLPAAAGVEMGMAIVVAIQPNPSSAVPVPAPCDPEIIGTRCRGDDLDPRRRRLSDDDDRCGNSDINSDVDACTAGQRGQPERDGTKRDMAYFHVIFVCYRSIPIDAESSPLLLGKNPTSGSESRMDIYNTRY
jgi:hypothetical protein